MNVVNNLFRVFSRSLAGLPYIPSATSILMRKSRVCTNPPQSILTKILGNSTSVYTPPVRNELKQCNHYKFTEAPGIEGEARVEIQNGKKEGKMSRSRNCDNKNAPVTKGGDKQESSGIALSEDIDAGILGDDVLEWDDMSDWIMENQDQEQSEIEDIRVFLQEQELQI